MPFGRDKDPEWEETWLRNFFTVFQTMKSFHRTVSSRGPKENFLKKSKRKLFLHLPATIPLPLHLNNKMTTRCDHAGQKPSSSAAGEGG